jgi:hypothetical protein
MGGNAMSKLKLGIDIPTFTILILLMIGILVLVGCTQRALVRDCQDMKDTPFKNCEIVQKL